jgi:2-methylcitrate dehydratase
VALWHKIRTAEAAEWTQRYNDPDPQRRAFGGRLEIRLDDGSVISEEKAVADAHPNGARPWVWEDYVGKFDTLALEQCGRQERDRFIDMAAAIRSLSHTAMGVLHPRVRPEYALFTQPDGNGIFDYQLPT